MNLLINSDVSAMPAVNEFNNLMNEYRKFVTKEAQAFVNAAKTFKALENSAEVKPEHRRCWKPMGIMYEIYGGPTSHKVMGRTSAISS